MKELHDPYTELFSPQESEEFSRGTNGRYGGTGMLLGEQDERVVTVQRVFPNTPAYEAGVGEGDRIVAIGDTSTLGWGLNKVSERLRGTPGSKVTVSFTRPAVAQPVRLTFTRRVVRVPAEGLLIVLHVEPGRLVGGRVDLNLWLAGRGRGPGPRR